MHKNFLAFSAKTHYDLGRQMGEKLKDQVKLAISEEKDEDFESRKRLARKMLDLTKPEFPDYVDELKGYAEGAQVDFLDLWTLAIEDDAYIKEDKPGKCTTIITNNGSLIAHSEDWSPKVANNIYVLKKTIGDLTTLELYYICTLGGASIGINSNGFTTAVNTLFSTPTQIGIPKCIPARILLDTNNPQSDFEKIKKLKLADGYNHNIIDINGKIINFEFTINDAIETHPNSPFVHSNHCLTIKNKLKDPDELGTVSRLEYAKSKVLHSSSVLEVEEILEDDSLGKDISINNERTVARMVVNLEEFACYIWLKREASLGWIKYPLDFIKK